MLFRGHEASLRWRDVKAAGAIPVQTSLRIRALALALVLFAEPSAGRPLFRAPFRAFDALPDAGAFALGDFNADGALYMAVASFPTGTVVLLLNDGTGEFQPGFTLTNLDPYSITAADLNADGVLDLARRP